MPDIAMCNDKNCPKAPQCYRNPLSGTRPSELRQSWFAETPRKGDEREHFWGRDA